jgi:Sugar kinases, ribokinase family
MRKVIGIGETILDIIFKENQPYKAVPGGSVFNGLISLSRLDIPVSFISEIGNDHVGDIIADFLKENKISTDYVDRFPDGKSPVPWPFLIMTTMRTISFTKIILSNVWTCRYPASTKMIFLFSDLTMRSIRY